VISRFVAKEWFIESSIERRTYLSLLASALAASDWRCFSFAVMSNHVHLGLIAGADSLRGWLRPMHTNFAQWINARRERIGAVFVRGPNVFAVHDGGVGRLINYLHCNPVRAGVTEHPSQSDWTSHRYYLTGRHPAWLDVRCGLELGGFASGDDLDRWIEATSVNRSDIDEVLVSPAAPRGRPPRRLAVAAEPLLVGRVEQIGERHVQQLLAAQHP
jgi:hypothetical protein